MKPRWLLNENFPEPSVRLLRGGGWDVLFVSESLCGARDMDVLTVAREQHRWLATFDRDYGELVFRQGIPPPPLVLLLRAPSYRAEEPAGWVETLHKDGQFLEGHFHIFDGRSMRRRKFPPLSTPGSR